MQPRDRKRFRKLLDESKNFESLPLRTRLTDDEVARFAVNRYRFPGVEIKARLFRQYPYGEVASHVVGYIGRINDRDLDAHRRMGRDAPNYKGSDYIGKVGARALLRARAARHDRRASRSRSTPAGARCARCRARRRRRATTSRCRSTSSCRRSPRRRSATAAARWWRSTRRRATCSRSSRGPASIRTCSSTASTPRTGSCSTSRRTSRCSTGRCAARIRRARRSSRSSRCRALTSGKRTPTQTIFDPGYFQLPGAAHRFRDDKPGGHGTVDMYKSIVASCDTYYYVLASETDIDDTAPLHVAAGLRPQDRHRHRGRALRRAAVARVEAAALRRQGVPRRAPQVVPRRQHLRRHRPGLQRVHADAARARDRDDRQRRRRRTGRTW